MKEELNLTEEQSCKDGGEQESQYGKNKSHPGKRFTKR